MRHHTYIRSVIFRKLDKHSRRSLQIDNSLEESVKRWRIKECFYFICQGVWRACNFFWLNEWPHLVLKELLGQLKRSGVPPFSAKNYQELCIYGLSFLSPSISNSAIFDILCSRSFMFASRGWLLGVRRVTAGWRKYSSCQSHASSPFTGPAPNFVPNHRP